MQKKKKNGAYLCLGENLWWEKSRPSSFETRYA